MKHYLTMELVTVSKNIRVSQITENSKAMEQIL